MNTRSKDFSEMQPKVRNFSPWTGFYLVKTFRIFNIPFQISFSPFSIQQIKQLAEHHSKKKRHKKYFYDFGSSAASVLRLFKILPFFFQISQNWQQNVDSFDLIATVSAKLDLLSHNVYEFHSALEKFNRSLKIWRNLQRLMPKLIVQFR